MSKFNRLGLFRRFLPESPNVKPVGPENAAGLKRRGPEPGDSAAIAAAEGLLFGLTPGTKSAYEPLVPTPLATPALSPNTPFNALNGWPVLNDVIPEYCHPPSATFFHPLAQCDGRLYT